MSQASPLKRSGIYAIRNMVNGKSYVGEARNIQRRWADHRRALERGKHHAPALQHSWNKHGADAFSLMALEFVDDLSMLVAREQHWLDKLNASNNRMGYNISPTAGSPLGVKHSAETRAKVSAAGKGRKFTAEHRARISASNKGRVMSPETRAKLAARIPRSGFTLSEELKARIRASNLGQKRSPESRARISAAKMGNIQTAEHREKNRAAQLGRKHSLETREKQRLAALSRATPEYREMMSKAIAASHARRRAAIKSRGSSNQ